MDIIEIIVGILFVAIPVIFKAIGNRLEKSGSGKAGQFKRVAEAFEDEPECEVPEYKDPFEDAFVVFETPQEEKPVEVKPVEVQHSLKPKKAILQEEGPEKKKEKIDPKKLVLYSEIMKPKF